MKRYEITPVPKPRMTQRDKWQQRPCVMRYRDFKDSIRDAGVQLAETLDSLDQRDRERFVRLTGG